MSSPLLLTEEEPNNRMDLFFLFRWLFQELLINLNLMRNNELVKYLNYQVLRRHPQLLAYIKGKVKGKARVGKTPQEVLEPTADGSSLSSDLYLKQIEKAITVL